MKRGEVWWAHLPAPVGRRPVLVVTRSAAVSVRSHVVVAQVTRTIHNIPAEVPLTRAEGMPQDCVVNCDVLLTIPKARMERKITQLSASRIAAINAALRYAMDLNDPLTPKT